MTDANRKYLSNLPRKAALLLALAFSFAVSPSIQAADDWKLKDKDGARYQLSALKGKWVLVNFWAPWCPVCLSEMPDLNSLQKKHQDLQIIGIAVMYKSKREVMNVVQTHPVSYPIVMGNEDTASDFGEIRGMPTSFLYSPEGKLVGRHDGPLTQSEVELAIQGSPDAASLFSR